MDNNEFWIAIDQLILESRIIIDRPKGSKHLQFDSVYELDYGYLENTSSMDGGGIDVWIGSLDDKKCDAIICTLNLFKKDSEIKILIGCSEDEKKTIMKSNNDSQMISAFQP